MRIEVKCQNARPVRVGKHSRLLVQRRVYRVVQVSMVKPALNVLLVNIGEATLWMRPLVVPAFLAFIKI